MTEIDLEFAQYQRDRFLFVNENMHQFWHGMCTAICSLGEPSTDMLPDSYFFMSKKSPPAKLDLTTKEKFKTK